MKTFYTIILAFLICTSASAQDLNTLASNFSAQRLGPDVIIGGDKIIAKVTGPLTALTIPGKLSLPVPVAVDIPIKVKYKWEVFNSRGRLVTPGETTYLAPLGLDLPAAEFAFAPVFEELKQTATPSLKTFYIRVSITLDYATVTGVLPTVPGLASITRIIPEPCANTDTTGICLGFPVSVAAIPIPTVAAYFRHDNFKPYEFDDDGDMIKGGVFIHVPSGSINRSPEDLLQTLEQLRKTLSPLASTGVFALRFATVLTGINQLANAIKGISDNGRFVFYAKNEIDNLDNIKFVDKTWRSDVRADDEFESLILIGRPDEKIKCSTDANQRGSDFNVTIGLPCFVLIRNFNFTGTFGNFKMESIPLNNEVTNITHTGIPMTFGNTIDSMKFY
jgi:hypothetical protein